MLTILWQSCYLSSLLPGTVGTWQLQENRASNDIGPRQLNQQLVSNGMNQWCKQLTGLQINESCQSGQLPCNHSATHDLAVADHALPHVDETLHYLHHEVAVSFLVIVACQLLEHLHQPCVVGSGTEETYGKDMTCKSLLWLYFESVSRMPSWGFEALRRPSVRVQFF